MRRTAPLSGTFESAILCAEGLVDSWSSVMILRASHSGITRSRYETSAARQPIFSMSTTKTRVSFEAMPAPGDCAP
jgi:hypothetical protein